jgi:basic membrane lipoprotein Med (substrate-binding protein (PBP1-ABC) superfamily)
MAGSARRAASVTMLAAAVLACGDAEQFDDARLRVALLTPGSIADGGWNQGAYEGLLRVEKELGAQVSHMETRTPAEFEEGFRDYAARGFDLVLGHGFEYQEAAARVAEEHPDTIFVTTSGSTVRANLAPVVFEIEQATYLCGVLAGRLTRTGTVGLIGGIDIPSIRSTFVAFRAAVESVAPGARVLETYLGSWEDTAAAREAALAQIEEGADLLLHNADAAGRGVFQAVSERARSGARVYAFGTNRDQSGMAPDVVLASATLDIPGAFLEVARRVGEGRFRAEPMRLGMEQGVVAFVINPRLRGEIPAPVVEELERLERRIRDGSLVVPRGSF